MIAFLSLVLHVLVSPFKMQARLEAEIIMLRHQLNVLRRRVPSKPILSVADQLLFVCLLVLDVQAMRSANVTSDDAIIGADSSIVASSAANFSGRLRPVGTFDDQNA